MKIQIASDLHLEFSNGENAKLVESVDRDLLILAGDIAVGRGSKSFIAEQLQFSPVVYVPGNHEYYERCRRTELDAWWREITIDELLGLHYLQMDETVVDGCRFRGTTWYSDFWGGAGRFAQKGISDFQQPYNLPGFWDVESHKAAHEIATEWLKIGEPADVIVTHFPPTKESIVGDFRNPYDDLSIFNSYFINDKEDLVRELSPKLWVSGHTHRPFDYMVGDCRCIGNPCGYLNESATLNGAKVVDVVVS